MRRMAFACWVVMAFGVLASSASAAFPGGDGLLVVQPFAGRGLLLVDSHTGLVRRICPDGFQCDFARMPRWSPDGRALAFAAFASASNGRIYPEGISLIYPDGSCLACSLPAGSSSPAFTSDPALVSAVAGGSLLEAGIDGVHKATIVRGGVSDAVWSARGDLAIVRSGRVWAGHAGHLRLVGRGDSPSWSPDGSRLALVRKGWILIFQRRTRFIRPLIRGTAPAWSPDGRSIAFIDAGHRLSVVAAAGGRPRRVGNVRGKSVDWQPLPRRPVAGCATPPGSEVLVSSPTAIVTVDRVGGPPVYLGCLHADGRERFLGFGGDEDQASLAGNYAALANYSYDQHYGGSSSTVAVFDLRSGAETPLGGEIASCDFGDITCGSSLDQLVLNADGLSAAHTAVITPDYCPNCTVEEIVASDHTGVHTLDTVTRSPTEPPALTDLTINGDTLTWSHNGAPKSAQLH